MRLSYDRIICLASDNSMPVPDCFIGDVLEITVFLRYFIGE